MILADNRDESKSRDCQYEDLVADLDRVRPRAQRRNKWQQRRLKLSAESVARGGERIPLDLPLDARCKPLLAKFTFPPARRLAAMHYFTTYERFLVAGLETEQAQEQAVRQLVSYVASALWIFGERRAAFIERALTGTLASGRTQ